MPGERVYVSLLCHSVFDSGGLSEPREFRTAALRDTEHMLLLKCCFTSTETVGLLRTGAQDVHLDFHTAPELCGQEMEQSMTVCCRLAVPANP